ERNPDQLGGEGVSRSGLRVEHEFFRLLQSRGEVLKFFLRRDEMIGVFIGGDIRELDSGSNFPAFRLSAITAGLRSSRCGVAIPGGGRYFPYERPELKFRKEPDERSRVRLPRSELVKVCPDR